MGNEINVNDNGGLLNTEGMIDSMIVECSDMVKTRVSGNYVGFCVKTVDMVQRLTALKKGVADEMESKDEIIRELRRVNNDLTERLTGLPADRENEKDVITGVSG